jgi:hypothetical protein
MATHAACTYVHVLMYMAMRRARADRQTPSHQYRPVRDGRRQCWCWGHAADPMCVRACMDAVGLSEVSALTKRPCIACMHAAPCPAPASCLLKAIDISLPWPRTGSSVVYFSFALLMVHGRNRIYIVISEPFLTSVVH